MAEEENKKTKKKQSKSYQLRVIGPNSNSTQVLRFPKGEDDLVLVPGQVLTVGSGGDLSEEESVRLQETTSWNFERVDK